MIVLLKLFPDLLLLQRLDETNKTMAIALRVVILNVLVHRSHITAFTLYKDFLNFV